MKDQPAAVTTGAPAVRGGPEWRQLSFRASGLTIELEITGSGEHRRLLGQLIPGSRPWWTSSTARA